ncbi:MAG: hypothetical protein LUQ07_06190 [Methanospirillum sp.]|nr:hypothetical protein [Methanospirillum sp.]
MTISEELWGHNQWGSRSRDDPGGRYLASISGRLLEASERGMWNADQETIEKLQELFLKAESFYEGSSE